MKEIKIRTKPVSDFQEDEYIVVDPPNESSPEIITFFAGCHALRLVQRGRNDKHICFYWMTEDDGHWFASQNSSSSSWMPEFAALIEYANIWMKANALPDIIDNRQFGYKLK